MIEAKHGKCLGINKDGTPCPFSGGDSGFCHRHDDSPEAKKRRSAAGKMGGDASRVVRQRLRHRNGDLPAIVLKTLEDARILRERTLGELRDRRISHAQARVQLLAARDHERHVMSVEVQERLSRLETLAKDLGLDQSEAWLRIRDVYAARGTRIIGGGPS